MDYVLFVMSIILVDVKLRLKIIKMAIVTQITAEQYEQHLKQILDEKEFERWKSYHQSKNKKPSYEGGENKMAKKTKGKSRLQQVKEFLQKNPKASNKDISAALKLHPSYLFRLKKQL